MGLDEHLVLQHHSRRQERERLHLAAVPYLGELPDNTILAYLIVAPEPLPVPDPGALAYLAHLSSFLEHLDTSHPVPYEYGGSRATLVPCSVKNG